MVSFAMECSGCKKVKSIGMECRIHPSGGMAWKND